MAKIKRIDDLTDFKLKPVKVRDIVRHTGVEVEVSLHPRWLDKSERAGVKAKYYEIAHKVATEVKDEQDPSKVIMALDEMGTDSQVFIVQKLADGWDLDDEFNAENIARIIQKIPTFGVSAYEAIDKDYAEARRGN